MAKEGDKQKKVWLKVIARYGRIGLDLGFRIIGAFLSGFLIDTWAGSFPAFTIISLLAGLFISLYFLYRLTKEDGQEGGFGA
ncbi:MAG: AtpZ/AtpI family protein [Actinomycetota bacterium]|nr:AtpZ/AtpI family protein [Actinomycetota bacterium]